MKRRLQVPALRRRTDRPFYDTAPPEALASLDRGLRQLARGEFVSLDELSERLEIASKLARGTQNRPSEGS